MYFDPDTLRNGAEWIRALVVHAIWHGAWIVLIFLSRRVRAFAAGLIRRRPRTTPVGRSFVLPYVIAGGEGSAHAADIGPGHDGGTVYLRLTPGSA
jgi:hypothetical protein